MNSYPSARDEVKVANLRHSPMPKALPAQLTSGPTVPEQQSVPKSSLLDHKTNQICRLRRQKKTVVLLPPPELMNGPP
ncbi:unnamed protein product [Hymenolepis diminuta]|uniref:Uncharacterized protein n=1 Tax=Hymenolepis diminuta TaxID=6216 RepID=A0A564YY61_HYMDI|nr:unnamed protein product [Hymenolepis diminuta]